MLEILRNMWRRKLRTGLTIFGIVIGIFALTVMGSMAEETNAMISGAIKFFTGQITVTGKSGFGIGGQLIPKDSIDKLAKIKGVEGVATEVDMLLEDSQSMASFGMPAQIVGADLSQKYNNRRLKELELKSGRDLKNGDRGLVLVGSDIAVDKKLKVGKIFKVRGKSFKVIGIVAKTLTGPDKIVYMSIEDARELFIKSQPFLRDLQKKAEQAKKIPKASLARMPKEARLQIAEAITFKPENIYTGANVFWRDGANAEKVAKNINKTISDVTALSPKAMKKQLEQMSVVFNLIIMGSALVALVVGGLSVINTMIMSVSERTREIGVKRAIGARTRNILSEYLIEAGTIGLIGGLIGLGLGWAVTNAFNANFASKGVEIFLVSRRLVAGSLGFAFILGVLAGVYPAVHAARLNPVKALRTE